MKLELKHIVGYLPYGIRVKTGNNKLIRVLNADIDENFRDIITLNNLINNMGHKPILRPMSDLTKEIEHNFEKFIPVKKLGYNANWIGLKEHFRNYEYLPYKDVQKLYEWHFDIHDLIGKGLAIDINTLTK